MHTMTIDEVLALRTLREDDAEALFQLVAANRNHLREWLPWLDANTEGLIALIMLVEFGGYSISTGEHWHMPILFAILFVTNCRNAYRVRKKTKNCEHLLRATS